MLKRTLVAASLVAAFGANAGTVSLHPDAVVVSTDLLDDAVNGYVYSVEGSADLDDYTSPIVAVEIGADLGIGDFVTLDFGVKSNTVLSSVSKSWIKDSDGFSYALPATVANVSNSSITFELTAAMASGDTIILGAAPVSTGTDAKLVATTSLDFDDASVEAAGSVSVTYSVLDSNGVTAKDTSGTNTATLISLQNELAISVGTKIDAEIDVTDSRLSFAGSGVTADSLVFKVTKACYDTKPGATLSYSNLKESVTLESLEAEISGDFSWIVDNNAATGFTSTVISDATEYTASAVTALEAGTGTSSTSCSTTVSSNAVTYDFTITPGANKAPGETENTNAILESDFLSDVTVSYDYDGAGSAASATATASALNSGELALNADSSTVQAYPVGSGLTQFLWVTNASSAAGDISVTAIADGRSINLGTVGTAAAKESTYIATAVNEALAAEGITSGRVQLKVSVNASSVDVYAGYKVDADADRLSLTVN